MFRALQLIPFLVFRGTLGVSLSTILHRLSRLVIIIIFFKLECAVNQVTKIMYKLLASESR